jgi:hypothetical protein
MTWFCAFKRTWPLIWIRGVVELFSISLLFSFAIALPANGKVINFIVLKVKAGHSHEVMMALGLFVLQILSLLGFYSLVDSQLS